MLNGDDIIEEAPANPSLDDNNDDDMINDDDSLINKEELADPSPKINPSSLINPSPSAEELLHDYQRRRTKYVKVLASGGRATPVTPQVVCDDDNDEDDDDGGKNAPALLADDDSAYAQSDPSPTVMVPETPGAWAVDPTKVDDTPKATSSPPWWKKKIASSSSSASPSSSSSPDDYIDKNDSENSNARRRRAEARKRCIDAAKEESNKNYHNKPSPIVVTLKHILGMMFSFHPEQQEEHLPAIAVLIRALAIGVLFLTALPIALILSLITLPIGTLAASIAGTITLVLGTALFFVVAPLLCVGVGVALILYVLRRQPRETYTNNATASTKQQQQQMEKLKLIMKKEA